MAQDFTVGETLYFMFTTRAFATGIPTVLSGTPVVSAYEDDSATQITAGITLGVDHDSVVGMNLLTIVATGANGYEAGKQYNLVITTGTVDSVSVVGEVVAAFSLGAEAAFTRLGAPAGASIAADLVVIDDFVDGIETAVIANAAGADIAADIIAVKAETALIVADTNELQTDDVPGLISALNDISAAQVNAEVDTALADVNLDHLVGTATAIPAIVSGTYIDQMMDDGTAAFDRTTDSLQAIRDRGDSAWPTATGFSTHNAAAVWSVGTRVLTAGTNLNDIAAGDVWAVDATGQQVQGTFGQAIGDPGADADTIYGSVVTGAAGANIAVDIIAVKAETALIVADTNELQTDWVDGGRLDLLLDAIPTTAMRGTDSASTHSAADVWAAVTRTLTAGTNLNDISVTDILTTQMTEAYAANGVAPTLAQCQFAIHQMLMQFGVSGTSLTVRKLNNSTTAFVVTLDDATSPTDAKRV